MSDIRAAFFDIDGTLLPFGATALPVGTRKALDQLRENGIRIFLATGRPPVHLPHLHAFDDITFDGYVTMNGQYCFDAQGVIYSEPLPQKALEMLVPYLAQSDLAISFVERDYAYLNRNNALSDGFRRQMEMPIDDPVRSLTEPTYQLSAFLPQDTEAEFMAHCPGCKSVRWSPDFADILPADGGKTCGVGKVLEHYGWTAEQAIAFGDGDNDTDMLRYVGIGVAMGNAGEPVKAAADYVTAKDVEDGITKALRHFGLI